MFAVGHLSLGYILASAISKTQKTNINIPLILTLSIIPDIDIIIRPLEHRGPTHSIITAAILFIPLFIIYKKKATPYFAALSQHLLIGDLTLAGKIQLFWPLTTQQYGLKLGIETPLNIAAEWILFITSIAIMIKTHNITTFLKQNHSNLLLIIPLATMLMPTLYNFPLEVPTLLLPPHLLYIALFSLSLFLYILKITGPRATKPQKPQPTPP